MNFKIAFFAMVVVLACPVTGTAANSGHVLQKSANGITVELRWKTIPRREHFADGGSDIINTLGTGTLTISGLVPRQTFSLTPLLRFPYSLMVTVADGPRDSCGAVGPLAILPVRGQLPDVVAFGVENGKGCMPLPLVVVSTPSSGGWRYRIAEQFALEYHPVTNGASHPGETAFHPQGTFIIGRCRAILLPDINSSWVMHVCTGTVGGRWVTVALSEYPWSPDARFDLRPGDRVVLGSGERARVIGAALQRHDLAK